MRDTKYHILYTDVEPYRVGNVFSHSVRFSLKCDGKRYRVSKYPELFEYLGYIYGGKGNYFRVPDLRNNVIFSSDTDF